MRLLDLKLKAIGPFTDVTLDLSQGDHGLHMIVGPNEAGKSSSLRAISYLFLGFPTRVSDDFLHLYDRLRVGAVLRHSDGSLLEITRRKAAKNDLRDGDDTGVVKPESLSRFLGNLDRESFHLRFGIDHARLRSAGEEIRAGKGYLGEMLFVAGSGLSGLRRVQQTLQSRSGELFKPRGQNQRINLALSQLRDVQAAQKEYQLPSEDWRGHHDALKQAEQQAECLNGRLTEHLTERSRLDRLRSAIPLVHRARRLREELEALGDAPRLRDDFGKEARGAVDAQLLADRTMTLARAKILEVESKLEETLPSDDVLGAAEEIELLQQRLGTVRKAEADRANLDGFRRDKEHRAKRLLQDLGRSSDLDQTANWRLRGDEPRIIRALIQRRAHPRGQLELTRATISRQEELIAESERSLAELPPTPDVDGLRKALRSARKVGDLDALLAKSRRDLAKAEKKCGLALSQLFGWDQSAEQLQRLSVPSKESLDRFESRFQAMERRRERLTEARAKAEEAIRNLEAQVRAIDHAGDVPLESDLEAARARRDLGWRLVRAAWLKGEADEALLASFSSADACESLAERFEESLRTADQIGDRLRRESANVARKAGWISDIRGHVETLEAIGRDEQELANERAQLHVEWSSTTSFLKGERAYSVDEIRAWLREREQIARLIEQTQEAQEALMPIESLHERCIEVLRRSLGQDTTVESGGSDDLSFWAELAEARIQEADDIARKREKAEATIKAAAVELATARRENASAQAQIAEWKEEWAPRMERLGLEPDADPQQAEDTLDRIDELDGVLHDHSGFVVRINGMLRDEAAFRTDLETLCVRLGIDATKGSPVELMGELSRLLKDHRAIDVARKSLLDQLRQEQEKLRESENEQESARIRLDRLCREAGCDEVEKLDAIEDRSRTRNRIQDEHLACEEQLNALAAGAEIAAFSREVESANPDELQVSRQRLEDDVRALQAELEGVHRAIGAERGELARMDGQDDRAAQAAAQAQAFLAQLQGDVGRFAAMRLSSAVLRMAIERYREKSQGPVLARASRLFSELTLGSFDRLQVDDEGDGRMILRGVRPDGARVGVEGMSEGSHDQLYLALRLASLEAWLETNEPIPFIVDDILMSFDDRRATAALKVLAELSRRTQVLFFTHHDRLAELAVAHLPKDEIFVQRLPSRL